MQSAGKALAPVTAAITGVGAASVAAVRQLQTLCGLPANGSVDQTTWDHLCKLYALASGDGDAVRL